MEAELSLSTNETRHTADASEWTEFEAAISALIRGYREGGVIASEVKVFDAPARPD